ncbi:thioredoxin family protein [Leucobacter iarius]|uniref:Thioredoxin n=1 Tax=Leucobacter iarius TaxID=333963 RepID=A0ABN2L7I2_9MICO
MTIEATATTLQTALDGDRPVLIQFWAEWCAPCRAMIPIVDRFAAEHEDRVEVARVDIDAHPELAASYRVTAVPSFVVQQGDRVLDGFTGAMPPAAFAAQIDQALSR